MKYASIRGKDFRDFKNKYTSLKDLLTDSFKEEELKIIKEFTRNEIIGTFEEITLCKEENLEIEFGKEIEYNLTELSGLQLNIINKVKTEVEYIAYIRNRGYTVDYIEDNYKDIVSLYSYIQNEDTKEMMEMTKNAIPLTSSQIKRYNAYKQNCDANKIELDKQKLVSKLSMNEKDIVLYRRCPIYICRLIDRYVDSDVDIARKQGAITVGNAFIKMYNKLSKNGKVDKSAFVNMIEANRKEVYYAIAEKGIRKATITEIDDNKVGVVKNYENTLSEEDSNRLFVMGWALTGLTTYLKYAGIEVHNNELKNLECNIRTILDAVKMMDSDDFETKKLVEILDSKDVDYPDTAEDELNSLTYKQLFEFLKKNIKVKEKNNTKKIARKIAVQCIKYKRYTISEKQYYTVMKAYRMLLNSEDSVNFYDKNTEKMIAEIKGSGIKCSKVVNNIMNYANKYATLSEKQYNVIKAVYDEYIAERDKILTEVDEIDISDEVSTSNQPKEDTEDIMGNSLLSISDMLGGGDFD